MADKMYEALYHSRIMRNAAMDIRGSLLGEGAHFDDARKILTDVCLTVDTLRNAIDDLHDISGAFTGSRQLPKAKVEQAQQDMSELMSALKLAYSAAFAASRAMCGDLDYGIPEARDEVAESKPAVKSS